MDPRLVQKTIRIFLSSTFTDTRVDRNKLMEDVFEPVRDLCQQHGIAFEVVDLRWGKNANFAMKQILITVNAARYQPLWSVFFFFLFEKKKHVRHLHRAMYNVKFIKCANISCQ